MTTLFDQLVGTWALVSFVASADDGSISYPFGDDAAGYLTYTADGHVSAQLMRTGRPAYASDDIRGSHAHGDRVSRHRLRRLCRTFRC